MLVFSKTRMIEHNNITSALDFYFQIQSMTENLSIGIFIIWQESILNLENISITPQGIHAIVKIPHSTNSCFFSAFYASTEYNKRIIL